MAHRLILLCQKLTKLPVLYVGCKDKDLGTEFVAEKV